MRRGEFLWEGPRPSNYLWKKMLNSYRPSRERGKVLKILTILDILKNKDWLAKNGLFSFFGENIYFNIAFKPASSISKPQNTVDLKGNYKKLEVNGRHDPCFVYRAVPIVEAMSACVLMDYLL